MIFFSKLKNRLTEYKACRLYLGISIVQAIVTLTLIAIVYKNMEDISNLNYYNTDDSESSYYSNFKRDKMCIEDQMYIIFESCRLLLVLNAVLEVNSLLIYSITGLSVFAFAIELSSIFEYAKLTGSATEEETELIELNERLMIGCTCVGFIFVFLNIWISRKVVKQFGWGIYKKIGASMRLQKMYRIAQCFSMILRLDIIFELGFIILLMYYLEGEFASLAFVIPIPIAVFFSLLFAREAIARESHFLMFFFYCAQATIIGTLITIFVVQEDGYHYALFFYEDWYALIIYSLIALLFSIATIILGILAEINFGRGLKQYVQWSFYGLRRGHKLKAQEIARTDVESPMSPIKIDTIDAE